MHSNSNKTCVDCGATVSRLDVERCRSCAAKKRWADRRDGEIGPNPTGLCMCGCGGKTPIAPRGNSRLRWVKGQPIRWIHGHENRPTTPQYIVIPETGCWEWQWMKDEHGYGRIQTPSGNRYAHRVIYEQHKGPIPAGLTLDHLCRNRPCVNPDHLEPVTNTENIRRGINAKLTMSLAADIRRLYASGEYTQVQLSDRFGVNQSSISKVIRHQTWFHSDRGSC